MNSLVSAGKSLPAAPAVRLFQRQPTACALAVRPAFGRTNLERLRELPPANFCLLYRWSIRADRECSKAAPEARFLWNPEGTGGEAACENALEGAVRATHSDIRFVARTVPQNTPCPPFFSAALSAFMVFALTAFLPSRAWATSEDSQITVKAEVNRAEITIGDPVEYSIQIRHGAKVKILSQVPAPPEAIFKIKKVEDIDRKEGKQAVEGRKFTLTAFGLGEFILDPVKIEYRVGDGAPKSIETDKIYITVKSMAKGEDKKDIRGIKATLALIQKLGWILIVPLVLFFLSVLFLIYRKFLKNPELFLKPVQPRLNPEEEAMNGLNQLFESDLMRRGKIKEYYLKLSEILRFYFERRFHILTGESTTFEILTGLSKMEIDRALLEKIREVLEWADLAKFAKWVPEPAQVILINQKSKQIIEAAKPAAEPSGGI